MSPPSRSLWIQAKPFFPGFGFLLAGTLLYAWGTHDATSPTSLFSSTPSWTPEADYHLAIFYLITGWIIAIIHFTHTLMEARLRPNPK